MRIRVKLVHTTELEVSKSDSIRSVLNTYENKQGTRLSHKLVKRMSTSELIRNLSPSLEELGIEEGELFQVHLDFLNGFNKDATYSQIC
ncbi:vacuolar protein sorting protein 51 [Acrasis kona]|uniref:Vacuolar protein sorting protein 51 n=1 Tax=Acrasis kona TaxID=1008807 RepID=A0AAW2Z789_9EUKA